MQSNVRIVVGISNDKNSIDYRLCNVMKIVDINVRLKHVWPTKISYSSLESRKETVRIPVMMGYVRWTRFEHHPRTLLGGIGLPLKRLKYLEEDSD